MALELSLDFQKGVIEVIGIFVLIAGLLGIAIATPSHAAVVTDFSLTFQVAPPLTTVGTGTLGITGFTAGATYGAGDAHAAQTLGQIRILSVGR